LQNAVRGQQVLDPRAASAVGGLRRKGLSCDSAQLLPAAAGGACGEALCCTGCRDTELPGFRNGAARSASSTPPEKVTPRREQRIVGRVIEPLDLACGSSGLVPSERLDSSRAEVSNPRRDDARAATRRRPRGAMIAGERHGHRGRGAGAVLVDQVTSSGSSPSGNRFVLQQKRCAPRKSD